jgi:hypothetical protein
VFYVFLIVCGLIGISIYLLFIMNLVPGAADERLGVLEPLPRDVGKWKEEPLGAAEPDGLVREVRFYFYETSARLVRQVRYRNRETGAITRIEADKTVKRRRLRT